jgi:hypothetical protein
MNVATALLPPRVESSSPWPRVLNVTEASPRHSRATVCAGIFDDFSNVSVDLTP